MTEMAKQTKQDLQGEDNHIQRVAQMWRQDILSSKTRRGTIFKHKYTQEIKELAKIKEDSRAPCGKLGKQRWPHTRSAEPDQARETQQLLNRE